MDITATNVLVIIAMILTGALCVERITEQIKKFIVERINEYGIIRKELSSKHKIAIVITISATACSVVVGAVQVEMFGSTVLDFTFLTTVLVSASTAIHTAVKKVRNKITDKFR